MFNRKSISLFAVLAALGVLGVSATSAWATTVKPAGEAYTATAGLTKFIDFYGTGNAIECKKSEAKGVVPVAPFNALANGSVNGPLSSLTFEECEALGLPATVNTKASPDGSGYTLTANNENEHPTASVNVPGAGVDINVAGVCDITIPQEPAEAPRPVAASVIGPYSNETGVLSIKSQLPDTETCGAGLASPGVFFANGEVGTTTYTVLGDNTGLPIEILP